MRRYQPSGDRIAILPRLRWLKIFLSLALLSALHGQAQAGSASATLQVRARVISSCAVSTTALHSIGDSAQGRFNCPSSNPSISANSPSANPSANYTVTELPDSGGSVKLVTINF